MIPLEESATSESRSTARRLEQLWRFVRRSVLLVEAGLLLAALVVPVLSFDTDPDDREPATTLALLPAVVRYVGADATDFGDPGSHPYALSGGLWLTRIALLLLVAAIVLAAVATARLGSWNSSRAAHISGWVGAGLLIGVPLIVLAGQRWLPDDDVETTVGVGLVVSAFAGAWLVSVLRGIDALEE